MAEMDEKPPVEPADNSSEEKKPKSHHPRGKDGGHKPGDKRRDQRGKAGDKRRPGNFNNGPRRVSGGIRLRGSTDRPARNWWAQRWIRSMENVVDVNRLRRGKYYALQGQVLGIDEGDAEMIARVQGSRPKPYTVRISLSRFSDDQWENLLDVLSAKAIFAAQLLSGQMPINIEDAFAEAGVSLFPNRSGELLTNCTCPDWANPCKHVAATHYILGDRFDDDPFLLFRLRGRTQPQIIEGLRRHRLADLPEGVLITVESQPPPAVEELPEEEINSEAPVFEFDSESLGRFWRNPDDLSDLPIHITPPELPFPIIKRLGEPDAAGQHSMEELLGNSYLAVSQAAQIIAFMGGDLDEDEDDGEGD